MTHITRPLARHLHRDRRVRSAVALTLAMLSSVGAAQAQGARNLVRNSDFERAFSQPADGWRASSQVAGVTNERRAGLGIDGGACHVISVEQAVPVTWYQCTQTVTGAVAGGQYVLSGTVRAEDVRHGGGAYLGVSFYDSEGARISWVDTQVMLTGTTEWVRLVQPFVVPPTSQRVDVNLVLHGHGVAHYDRVQIEAGDTATEWVSREDSARLPDLPPGIAFTPQAKGNVAILKDSFPASGTPSDPGYLAELVADAGYGCALLDADAMGDTTALNAARFDVLVLPYGASFPAEAAEALQAFCRDGGSLFVFGGYPFDRLLARQDGRWVDVADLAPNADALAPLFDLSGGPTGWTVSGRETPHAPAPAGEGREGASLHLGTDELQGWVTAGSPQIQGLPEGSRVTAFWGRAAEDNVALTMEWGEADGSRWRTRFDLTREWKLFAAPHTALEYWHDNPSVGRGGPEDRFQPNNAVQLRFGITQEFLRGGAAYHVDIDEVLTGEDPFPWYRDLTLNSRRGAINPATFLQPPATAISICDASAPLMAVARLQASPGQTVVSGGWQMEGAAEGHSATGQTAQGHAGAPLKARWIPLVDAVDRYGRVRGTAMAVMHHFAGEYPGASWAYSGISDRDLFPRGDAVGAGLFRSILARLIEGAFLFDGRAEPRCVQRGEAVRLVARAANLARDGREVVVRLALVSGNRTLDERTMPLSLGARTSEPVEIEWSAPPDIGGLVVARWELLDGESVVDQLEAGLVVWDESGVTGAPRLSYDRCYFSRDRRPEFLLGTQIYWGNATATGTDPLRWDTQLARMADSGIKVARSFQSMAWAGSGDGAWPPRDAMVQLARDHGVSLFYERVSSPTTDPSEVTERAALARAVADRYRSDPGWFIDIINEPSLSIGASESDSPEFRAYLLRKYGTLDGLRAAWGDDLTEASFDDIEIGPAVGEWSSMRAVDTGRFMTEAMRRWTAETAAAAHAADPSRLVSVGHLQGFGSAEVMWDPIDASYDMDFANRHYYGDMAGYAPELKQIDMRYLGKAPSTGEFGNTSHPGLAAHFVYAPEEEAAWHYSYIVHSAFGLGGAFVANWHWQDPIEDIFPCGLLWQDGAPRPRFHVYRNLGVLFRRIQPRYEPPEVFFVIPTSHRFGASKAAVEGALNRSLAALVSLHVEFGTVAEERVDELPATARVLVWPVPYCPSDGAVAALESFVRAGGQLYVSGDVSYDETRRRTRTDRLAALCGVEFISERYPDIQWRGSPEGEVTPVGASDLAAAVCADGPSRPGIEVRAASAEILATAGGIPAATLAQVGAGRVLFVADPVELRTEPRATLAAFLHEAGVARHAIGPDLAQIHSHRVPGEDGGMAQVLFNLGEAPITVSLTDLPEPLEITLAPQAGGAAIFAAKGELVAVEGLGVNVDGRPLLQAEATAALVSLTGDDLRTGKGLVLLPTARGVVTVSGVKIDGPVAAVGEVQGGRWVEFERIAPDAGAGAWELALDTAAAESWIVLALPDEVSAVSGLLCADLR